MAKKEFNETVIKEFDQIRKGYKTRVVKDNDTGKVTLDVRNYVESAKYTGFTPQGLRLDKEAVVKAIEVFTAALPEME